MTPRAARPALASVCAAELSEARRALRVTSAMGLGCIPVSTSRTREKPREPDGAWITAVCRAIGHQRGGWTRHSPRRFSSGCYERLSVGSLHEHPMSPQARKERL
jgi:hypothetical protein